MRKILMTHMAEVQSHVGEIPLKAVRPDEYKVLVATSHATYLSIVRSVLDFGIGANVQFFLAVHSAIP
jgi:hypothetical protein